MSGKPSNSHDDDNNSNTDSNKDDGFDIPPEEETATPQRLASPLQDITPTHHELNLNPDINYWIRKKTRRNRESKGRELTRRS